MNLGKLLSSVGYEVSQDIFTRPITDIKLDSREVELGDMFICNVTNINTAKEYIAAAIHKGAIAICIDRRVENMEYEFSIPLMIIDDLDEKIGTLANTFYGEPSHKMPIIGVTGTNGKTSVTNFIAQICDYNKMATGIIGTLGYGFFDSLVSSSFTTADCVTNHKRLARLKAMNSKIVALEASSHGLAQKRLQGIEIYIAVFTNLSPEHLDYHKDMDSYFAEKSKLFLEYNPSYSVINIDDQYGLELIQILLNSDKKVVGVSTKPAALEVAKDIPCLVLHDGKLSTPWGEAEFKHNLVTGFNNYNILCSIATACLLEIPLNDIMNAVSKLKAVPGRMDVVSLDPSKPKVIVDFAHTPDALDKVLSNIKDNLEPEQKLWCVFGCGGDRDKSKRPLMLQAAKNYADKIIITEDNSRQESFEDIVSDILSASSEDFIVEQSRDRAIKYAINNAANKDVILIAGKGHERYQLIKDDKLPFIDKEVALKYLEQRVNYEFS